MVCCATLTIIIIFFCCLSHLLLCVYNVVIRRAAYPSPLNYNGFPKSVCVSVNEVICHGIPDDRPFVEGDIVNCDVTAFRDVRLYLFTPNKQKKA
jgi:hypothetical protein